MEQAHADQPPLVMDALDDVSVQLELGDDGGWKVNPAGVKLRQKRPAGRPRCARAPTAAAAAGVKENNRPICALQRDCGRLVARPGLRPDRSAHPLSDR
jgi:hypothetical protein